MFLQPLQPPAPRADPDVAAPQGKVVQALAEVNSSVRALSERLAARTAEVERKLAQDLGVATKKLVE